MTALHSRRRWELAEPGTSLGKVDLMTTFLSGSLIVLSVSFVLLAAPGCSDAEDGSGGSSGSAGGSGDDSTSPSSSAGGEGGAASGSVVGEVQDGDCETAQAFAEACDAQGGRLGDNCQNAICGGPGWQATCYEPPPEPGAGQFSCDGLFNCSVAELCHVVDPVTDGCFRHGCEPLPTACGDEPTCECLVDASGLATAECEETEGHFTLRSRPL